MRAPTVAIATCAAQPAPDAENRLLIDAVRARGADARAVAWNARPPGGWDAFDAVVVRATWDYTAALPEFLDWAAGIGGRLHNRPDVIAWNADKRYLFDLGRAGLPVVAGEHVAPGASFRPPSGRHVVKPTVSAGARDTALYDAARADAAREHVRALHAAGRDVLVQPYLSRVDDEAETAVVLIDGQPSHCMRKGPLLALDQPPVDGLFRVEDMRRRACDDDVLHLAHRTHAFVAERFGVPLYARVDVLRDDTGEPAVLEVELIEPSLFLDHAPGSAERLAGALLRRTRPGA